MHGTIRENTTIYLYIYIKFLNIWATMTKSSGSDVYLLYEDQGTK